MFWIITKRRHARLMDQLRAAHAQTVQEYRKRQDLLVLACAYHDTYLMGLYRKEPKI